MDKQRILDEVRRLANANGGKPPGEGILKRHTGITRRDWYPNFWLRWGDALVEAGYPANQFQKAINDDVVIQSYISLVRELKRLPIAGEMIRKRKTDKSFPTRSVFYRFGGKEKLLNTVVRYCREHPGLEDVIEICMQCKDIPMTNAEVGGGLKTKVVTGFVYLMKSGRHYKIGRTVSVGGRERQLAIKIPVPPTTIHSIETDDPVGVEAYWH